MSVEQIIVLVAFVIALLVRAAKQVVTEVKEQESAKPPPAKVRAKPPARRAATPSPREVPRRVSRREPPAPPAPAPADLRPQPSDVAALRRAIVLATLLGPPRALKDATALDSRER